MDIKLLKANIFNSMMLKKTNMRSNLFLPHGFGRGSTLPPVRENFKTALKCIKSLELIRILQENNERRRVVALVNIIEENKAVVIKWLDTKAPLCFNYFDKHDNEKSAHFELAQQYPKLIPSGFDCGRGYIIVDYIEGASIYELSKSFNSALLIDAVGILCDNLVEFYNSQVYGNIDMQIINKQVIDAHNYGIHVKGPTGAIGLLHSIRMKKRFHERYRLKIKSVIETAGKNGHKMMAHRLIYDLDEHNILFCQSKGGTYIVDWEDLRYGAVAFDISYFAARLLNTLVAAEIDCQLALTLVEKCRDCLRQIEPGQVDLFNTLLSWRIMQIQANPWLWPNHSTWELCIESLYSRNRKLMVMGKIAGGLSLDVTLSR